MNDMLIWVNENDEEIGFGEKMQTHIKGQLHRAFSIFIFDWVEKKMLLQKRAHDKYHSGGLWTNACCSHPRKGELMEYCLNERIKEELGIQTNFHIVDPAERSLLIDGADVIYSCGKFLYFADFGKVSENEIDHVFLYSPIMGDNGFSSIAFNKYEIDDIKWVTIEDLMLWMEREPNAFTAWFQSAFTLACQVLCRQAGNLDLFFS